MIKIEKNIPVPESEEIKCPFAEMDIGDSFFISLAEWVEISLFGGGIFRLADFYAPGKRFIYRSVKGPIPGYRIWRIGILKTCQKIYL